MTVSKCALPSVCPAWHWGHHTLTPFKLEPLAFCLTPCLTLLTTSPSPITTSPLPNLSPAFLRTSIRRASPITWTAERYLMSIYMPDCCLEPPTPQSLGWSFLKAWPSRTITDNSYRALTDARFSSHTVTNPSLPSRAHRQTLNKPSGKSQQDPPLSHAHASPSIHPWFQHPCALP